MLGNIGWQEILIILLIVLVLFGARKIPDLARGLGKGIREFRDAMSGKDPTGDENEKSGPGVKNTPTQKK